ncbi:MAG: 4-hydroxythreonine-4-phosphate dehydrogenase PdxA [Eubacteriales bacterium]|nr:4-hydroxythreonine-4-phosphate dehydrogenase PdxA [Eubacteriales bacterium]
MARPLIAIPMGDPAGVGPEIVLGALGDKALHESARMLVAGDAGVLERALNYPNAPALMLRLVASAGEGDYQPGIVNAIDLKQIASGDFVPGRVDGRCGQAAYTYIKKAIQLALAGEADAIATPPINKESLRAGGIPYIGHTEIFAALTRTPDPLTLFEVRGMRVFFLSRHVSLRQACDLVKKDRVMDYARRSWAVLRQLGVREGVMAVAGLNPHCGENGLFGDEEVRELAPAVKALQAEGLQVAGPIGADSVFAQALEGKYNSVLSLYHDQGHIAAKTVDFMRTVSITAGMPILRTSVDHGTAFDIAGKGVASPLSMAEAVRVAVKYAPYYRNEGKV